MKSNNLLWHSYCQEQNDKKKKKNNFQHRNKLDKNYKKTNTIKPVRNYNIIQEKENTNSIN